MSIRVLLTLLVTTLWAGCSTPPPAQPTTTPQPAKSKLRIESFLTLGKGGVRSDSIHIQAGDTIKTEIVLSGLQNNGAGKVVGTVTLALVGEAVSSVQLQPPTQNFEQPFVDEGRLTVTTSLVIGPTDPPGVYKMSALVVDKSADLEVEKQVSVTIEGLGAGGPTSGATPPEAGASSGLGEQSRSADPSETSMQVTRLEFAASEDGPGMDPATMSPGSKAYIRYKVAGLVGDPEEGHTAMTINAKVTKPDGTVEGPVKLAADTFPPELEEAAGSLTMEAAPDDPPGVYHMELTFVDDVSKAQLIAKFAYTLLAP